MLFSWNLVHFMGNKEGCNRNVLKYPTQNTSDVGCDWSDREDIYKKISTWTWKLKEIVFFTTSIQQIVVGTVSHQKLPHIILLKNSNDMKNMPLEILCESYANQKCGHTPNIDSLVSTARESGVHYLKNELWEIWPCHNEVQILNNDRLPALKLQEHRDDDQVPGKILRSNDH